MDAIDVAPGKKTSIVAGAFTVLQAAVAAGFVDPSLATTGSQIAASLFAFTLALKARRAARGK
jgi:hypothetical protein